MWVLFLNSLEKWKPILLICKQIFFHCYRLFFSEDNQANMMCRKWSMISILYCCKLMCTLIGHAYLRLHLIPIVPVSAVGATATDFHTAEPQALYFAEMMCSLNMRKYTAWNVPHDHNSALCASYTHKAQYAKWRGAHSKIAVHCITLVPHLWRLIPGPVMDTDHVTKADMVFERSPHEWN